MISIFLFAIGIMYTPGPVNLLSIGAGLRKSPAAHAPFCLGVACALFVWFALVGYAGTAVAGGKALPYIGAAGCVFILYLAFKVLTSPVSPEAMTQTDVPAFSPGFRDGLFMQLLNPKTFLVVLPVATVQFPAAGIAGPGVVLWSAALALLGFGAPMAYAVAGAAIGKKTGGPRMLRLFNLLMGLLLVFAALDIAYGHVYLPLAG